MQISTLIIAQSDFTDASKWFFDNKQQYSLSQIL